MERKYSYAFTVKDNRTGSEEYEDFIDHLGNFGDISQLRMETFTKSGLPTKKHLHGILKTNDKLYFKATRKRGFHTHFKMIKDAGWASYIKKQDHIIDWSSYQLAKHKHVGKGGGDERA